MKANLFASRFMKPFRLLGQLRAPDKPPAMPAGLNLRGYAICTTARSGSNFLCELITATGWLGCPKEYFNWRGRERYDGQMYPASAHGQLQQILLQGMTPNGVYGLKVFSGQSDKVLKKVLWFKELPRLSYVFLVRNDLLGQAISLEIATQTKQFRSGDAAGKPAIYSRKKIEQQIKMLSQSNASWEVFFAKHAIVPLRLIYEDVVADPQAAIRSIANLVGENYFDVGVTQTQIKIQRSELNDEWRKQFLKDVAQSG